MMDGFIQIFTLNLTTELASYKTCIIIDSSDGYVTENPFSKLAT